MKELLLLISGKYNNRYTLRGKKRFLNDFFKAFKKLKYNVELDTAKPNIKKLINMYVGNIETAKVIFVCPYDTSKISLLPKYKFYPLDYRKNIKISGISYFVDLLISFCCAILCYIVVTNFKALHPFLAYGSIFILLFFIIIINIGIPTPYSFNRNTAAVTLSYLLLEEVKDNIAVMFCDRSISSYEGINEAKKYIDSKKAKGQIIYLDCIAYGESIFLAHTKKSTLEAKRMIKIDKSIDFIDWELKDDEVQYTPLNIFEKGIYIGCGSVKGDNIVVYKTRGLSDCECDIERLEKIKDMLIGYVNERSLIK